MTSDPKEALERLKWAALLNQHGANALHVRRADLAWLIAKQEGLEREVERLTKERDDARRIAMAERNMCDSVMRYRDEYLARAEAAESKLSALSEACRPFIAAAEQVHEAYADDVWLWQRGERTNLTVGDLRALRRALLDPAVPVETKGSVSSTKGGGDQENLCGSGAQVRPSRGSPTDRETSGERAVGRLLSGSAAVVEDDLKSTAAYLDHLRTRNVTRAVTVWADGTWREWGIADAEVAAKEPDHLVTIPMVN